METWLLAAYWKSPASYRMVPTPNPTTYRLVTIPHDWHTTVRYDPSGSSEVNSFCHLKAIMRRPISDLLATYALSRIV